MTDVLPRRPRDEGAPPQIAAFGALDWAGVRWAVLRDDPLRRDAEDIDLLVHPRDVHRIDTILAGVGFGRLLSWRHGDHRFYFAYDEPHDHWVKLDALSRFEYRAGLELPATTVDAVLQRRERLDGVWRVQPADEFWALLLHCLLDRGVVERRHLDRLTLLAGSDPTGPLRRAIARPDVTASAVSRARAGDATGLAALRPSVQALLGRPTPSRRLALGARSALAPLLKAVLRPGIGVVVVGPDGAGKSTLVRSLVGTLPLPVRTYYAGLYGGRLRTIGSSRIPGAALTTQLAVMWAAYLSAALQRRRGRVTVFDRYGYDAMLPSDGRPGTKRRLRRALLGAFVPRPDLVLVLEAPAELLHDRKGGHDLAEMERRRIGYRQLAQRLSRRMRVELIETDGERAAVRRRATRLIWSAFAGRAEPRPDHHIDEAFHFSTPANEVGPHGDR